MSSKNKTFLWLIPKWTLPATDGARVATDRLIKNMVKAGAIVDVMCLGNAGEKIDIAQMKEAWKVRDVYYKTRPLPQSKVGKALFYIFKLMTSPFCPLTMSSFNSYTVKDFVHSIAEKKHYDYIFLDGLHLGSVFIEKGKFVKPKYADKVIYRAHNLETEIWQRAFKESNNIFKKIILNFQSKFVASYEKVIINASDLVAPISLEDDESIKKLASNPNSHITLLGMDFNHPLEFKKQDKTHFLFLGRLDWPPNKDGLKWLLDEVWPNIDQKRFHLDVAGSGNRDWLKDYHGMEGVTFHGFVDDINDLYKTASASLIPIFYGSGTRIKVVETYTKGRSMISTAMGAQGSSLRPEIDYINVESAQDWIKAINNFNIELAHKQAQSGAHKLKDDFDEVKVAKNLYSKLL